jgi:hypothetical protein
MARYNALFKYLLRLKRVQLLLEATWAAMRAGAAERRPVRLSASACVFPECVPTLSVCLSAAPTGSVYVCVCVGRGGGR